MKQLKNFNLHHLFFVPLILTIVITFMLSLVLYSYTSKNFKNIYVSNSENYSKAHAQILEQNREYEKHIQTHLTETLVLTGNLAIENRDILSNEYLNEIATLTGVHFIWWFSPTGEVLFDNTGEYVGWTPTPGDPIDNFIKSGLDFYDDGIRKFTDNDTFLKIIYIRTADGYFIETALEADYVVAKTEELSYNSIVRKVVDNGSNIEFSYVIDKDKTVIADSRDNVALYTEIDLPLLQKVLNGETVSRDVFYYDKGYNVLEIINPIVIDGEVEAILVISFTLEFYRDMNNMITLTIFSIGAITIIAFGLIELIQVIRPLRLLDKSINSFNVKAGIYQKPKQKMSAFKNMFLSLDALANKIQDSNKANLDLNDEIGILALTDYLTKLPNRLHLTQSIEKAIITNTPFAVLFIDLDDFKNKNDTKGHIYGDKILIEVGKKISRYTNQDIFVSRYGGDEFVIIIPFAKKQAITSFLELLYADFLNTIKVEEDEFILDLSIGLSIFPKDGDTASELIRKADIAMYESKNTGKRKYTFYKQFMSEVLLTDNDILDKIRTALNTDGFKILLQPQIDMRTGEIVSYEALARFKKFNIPPIEFIRIAEKSHLINSIGRVISRKAIESLDLFRKNGIPLKTMYVNFSANQFNDIGLLDYIKSLLDEYEIDYSYFGIELTESILIENEVIAIEFLNQIAKIGFKLALDDFGSGQAGLDYLTKYKLEVVKLDRSLALKYLTVENLEIYDTIIKLAKLLDFNVLAEGIESEDQIKLLRLTDCHIVQGFYYYKPMDVDEILLLNINQSLF